jgi:hypothetical protein
MTGRALAVIIKLNFWKLCDHKKSFYFGPQPNNFMVNPIYPHMVNLSRFDHNDPRRTRTKWLLEPLEQYVLAAKNSGPRIPRPIKGKVVVLAHNRAAKVGVFLVWHKPHKFEMDLGRLAPASEVAGGHTIPF